MKVLFWGTPEFAVPTLRALIGEGHEVVAVVTQPDRPKGRGRVLTPSPVKVVAEAEGLPVLTPDRPRGEDFMAQVAGLEPEISVVVAYGHILRPEVLELPRHGSWNVHASLLPDLRGAAPIHWAVARGLDRTGVTVMQMEEGLDSGPMLVRRSIPITPMDSSTELAPRLAELGAAAMIEGLALLEAGVVEPEEQDHEAATYAPKVSREVAHIDWALPGAQVRDHVRAMDDVPGAWTLLKGQPLKLFRPSPEVADGGDARPGEVVDVDPEREDGFAVATADGAVRFAEVQPPGKRRMGVASWLRGRSVECGVLLGE